MARKMTDWPSKRGPIAKIMPSDGCKGDTVPLVVGKWYNFHEFGWHLGNPGLDHRYQHTVQTGGGAYIPGWNHRFTLDGRKKNDFGFDPGAAWSRRRDINDNKRT